VARNKTLTCILATSKFIDFGQLGAWRDIPKIPLRKRKDESQQVDFPRNNI
jgi:hypothetical protein